MEQIDVDMGAGEPIVLSNVTMDSDKCTLKSCEVVDGKAEIVSTKIRDDIEIKKSTRDEDILRKLRAFANCLISGAT